MNSVEGSVTQEIRDRIASWSGFLCPHDLADIGDQTLVWLALSNILSGRSYMDTDLPVRVSRVRNGLYFVGDQDPSAWDIAWYLGKGKERQGIGYANGSDVAELGLTQTAPEVVEIAFPMRPPAKVPGLSAKWVGRAACIARSFEHLNPVEVAVLESLNCPELITVPEIEATELLVDLGQRGQIGWGQLTRASQTEPALAREGLRNLYLATGRDELARQIAVASRKQTREQAFKPPRIGGGS